MRAPASGVDPAFHRLLDSLAVAVYTIDAAGTITFFNEAAVTLWGRRPAPGETWSGAWRTYWPDGRVMPSEESVLASALTQEHQVETGVEAELERPDGSRRLFVAYPTPLRDAEGKVTGAANVLVDVTERRKAEEALREAVDALEISNKVKDEFLGLVSHELRTPVTTIYGNALLLRRRAATLGTDEAEGMLGDLAEESTRLLGIIENLLLLTRLESGPELDLEPQLVAHVTRRSVEAFGTRHPARRVELSVESGRIVVEADEGHLEMLLQNLLTNADKYSPISTEIEVVVSSEDGEARVRVLDRGMGIGEVNEAELFATFHRTEAARRRSDGLGIGLAVCRRIVESLGGRIWVRPREGGGTEAGFALPLTEAIAD